jgi:hypothetical protein
LQRAAIYVLGSSPTAMISTNLVHTFLDLMIHASADLQRQSGEGILELCRRDLTILSVDSQTMQLFKSILQELDFEDDGMFLTCILHFADSNLQLLIDSGILKEMDQENNRWVLYGLVDLLEEETELNNLCHRKQLLALLLSFLDESQSEGDTDL